MIPFAYYLALIVEDKKLALNFANYYNYRIHERKVLCIPKLSPAADDHFKELVTGKIKISLYDFSNGKGDNGIYTYFNLDLKQFRYIYERAKLSHLPAPYESSKIHCQSVETDGPFKGYCKSFRFYLARNATYIDKKTGETCTRRAPWYLKITNGYAIPGKDGKGEQRNSFKQTSSAYINLSDEDFLDRMESIHIYIEEYTHIVAQNSLAANLKKLDDIYKRGEYDPNLPSEAHSSTQQQKTLIIYDASEVMNSFIESLKLDSTERTIPVYDISFIQEYLF